MGDELFNRLKLSTCHSIFVYLYPQYIFVFFFLFIRLKREYIFDDSIVCILLHCYMLVPWFEWFIDSKLRANRVMVHTISPLASAFQLLFALFISRLKEFFSHLYRYRGLSLKHWTFFCLVEFNFYKCN